MFVVFLNLFKISQSNNLNSTSSPALSKFDSVPNQSTYWTVSFGQAVRTGFSCRECRSLIPMGSEIAVRDGRKMRLFYHRSCYSGDSDPRSQSKSSFHTSDHLKKAFQDQAPAVKGRGKW